eukprot:1140519-Pelagomonas_calceolata.AAC.3
MDACICGADLETDSGKHYSVKPLHPLLLPSACGLVLYFPLFPFYPLRSTPAATGAKRKQRTNLPFPNLQQVSEWLGIPGEAPAGHKQALAYTLSDLPLCNRSKRQNGLVFQERAPAEQTSSQQPFKGASAYFEPHCDFDESSVSRVGQVGKCKASHVCP